MKTPLALTPILAATLLLAACDMPAGTAPMLTGAEWQVADIAGRGVVADSPATLQFMADGTLAGNASCNRLIGSYERDGNALNVTPAGTTMMACAPALMAQERTLLDLLPSVTGYAIDTTGALILSTRAGQTITARRS